MSIKNTNKNTVITRNQMPFEDWFRLAEEYYQEHGNLLVPLKYVTKTGDKLGIWIINNRRRYADGLLSLNKIKALNSIGMVWNIPENNWQDMFNALLEYQTTHGNLNVPSKYVTESKKPLGRWLINQRGLYLKGTLPEEHLEKLESIGLIWKNNENKWSRMYKLATEYQKEHGNINIPQNYITLDGEALGLWIQTQRNNYRNGKLKPERIKLLEDIGITWQINQHYSWDEMFLLAKKYYEEYGNLLIPKNHKASNGANLGTWLSTQRNNYRKGILSEERKKALESIGVVWDFKVSSKISKYLKDLARKTSIVIDEEINKDILNHISLIELQSKIKYVTDMGALPIDNNGRLIDIFSMSSIDMKAKYGISLEAIIESYEVSNARKLYF